MKTATWLLAPVLALLMGSAAAEEPAKPIDPHKAAVIQELMDVTGAATIAVQMVDAILDSERKDNPDIDPAFWDRIRAKVDPKEMTALVVPIYDRHFSTEDLEASVAFYKSAPGQRILHEMPATMKESLAAGQEWGQRLGQEVVTELQAERSKTKRM
jgi:hypothetical protein